MCKAIIFDLDGVLVDTKEMHFTSLNKAIESVYPEAVISKEEHLTTYDGLPTRTKLELLTKDKNLPVELHDKIWNLKQTYTSMYLDSIQPSIKLCHLLSNLKDLGYLLFCASNAVPKTVSKILDKLGIDVLFDGIYDNHSTPHSKPNPSIYLRIMSDFGLKPEECLILEDSPVGRQAAQDSHAHVMPIDNIDEVNFNNISRYIAFSLAINNKLEGVERKPYEAGPINILIPMGGMGTRFAQAGYTFPKPLIDVHGKPMIQLVVENIGIKGHYIFIVQKEHYQKYALSYLLPLIAPGCSIHVMEDLPPGAAAATLLVDKLINNDTPLIIANSDQLVDWKPADFIYKMSYTKADGGILTFQATHPKWSYAKVGEDGFVTEVAEKKPISTNATVGIYYYRKGSEYVQAVRDMMAANDRTNNEFYVCPAFNYMIKAGKKIKVFPIEKMWGLGTPEDLEYYMRNKQ